MGEISQHTWHIVHVHKHLRSHITLQLVRRWTFDLDIRSITNRRSTRYVLGKASEYRRRPRSYDVDTWSINRRREVAHGGLCSSLKPGQTIFFATEQLGEKRDRCVIWVVFYRHQPTTHLRSRYRINPRSTRFMSGKASDHRWRPPKIHVDPWSRGGEVARDVLRSLPKPDKLLFLAIGDGSRFFVICFLYTSGQMFFSQTPGRRPPYITGLRVNSPTLGWIGAPNELAPLRVHDAIAVFVARCLTRTPIADQGLWGFMNMRWIRPRKYILRELSRGRVQNLPTSLPRPRPYAYELYLEEIRLFFC